MVPPVLQAVCLAALLPFTTGQGFYGGKGSTVLELDQESYASNILASNHTSIVEFYAPWCGHCKNLKPVYEKAARSLAGLAKVAAINCDEEKNGAFCNSMGVQGFPTLKIVKPDPKKPGKPIISDYQGERSAKAIAQAVKEKVPNHVTRLTTSTYEEWLAADKLQPKAILFSEKGTTSALIRALAIDFLGSISVGQARAKEAAISEKFSITSYPTLILLPSGDAGHIVYNGPMEKPDMTTFLRSVAEPNPDPAPRKPKKPKSPRSKPPQASETLADTEPLESPDPIASPDAEKPIAIPRIPVLDVLSPADLAAKCLTPKSGTCVVILSDPSHVDDEEQTRVLASMAEIHDKLAQRGTIFPFYAAEGTAELKGAFELTDGAIKIVAVNGKKGWFKKYDAAGTGRGQLGMWIDGLRMGEGVKYTIPDGLLSGEIKVEEPVKTDEAVKAEETVEVADEEAKASEGETPVEFEETPVQDAQEPVVADPVVEAKDDEHDEL